MKNLHLWAMQFYDQFTMFPTDLQAERPDLQDDEASEALSTDERLLVEYWRRVKGLEKTVDHDEVENHLHGMRSTFAALAQMACVIAKEKPEDFKKLATIVQYNGAMWWEWYLRNSPDEIMDMMDKLGRASSEIGHGLYPMDDKTHPISWPNPQVVPLDHDKAMELMRSQNA